MNKVLVIGGAGYIGSHTVHTLIQKGYDPIVVDNLSKGHRHNVDARRLHVLDMADTDALAELMESSGARSVIHFAGFIAVGESTEEPELYFSNNVGGTLSLFQAMQRAGVRRLVFSSSAAVYGTPERTPIPEDMPFAPVSPYGESKVMVEKVLGWLSQYRGLRSISMRYFNACGADPSAGLGEEHDPETHLIPLLLRAVRTGEPVTLFGDDYDTPDGTCIRDYIHVRDLAEAHVLALESLLLESPWQGGWAPQAQKPCSITNGNTVNRVLPEKLSAVYNVGTGSGHSVLEVLRAVEAVTGRQVPHVVGPRRAGDPPVLVADSTRLARELGWKPRYTELREIVGSAWEFEKKRGA